MPTKRLPLMEAVPSGGSIIRQASDAPILRGTQTDGETFLCGGCGATLVQDIERDAVWDIGFRCGTCDSVSASPSLPPGRPLPPNTVLLRLGEYIVTTVDLPSDSVLAGLAAAERRRSETGRPTEQPRALDASLFNDLASRGEALLGSDFAKLDAGYRRGLERAATPPKAANRLIQLIATARDDAATFAGGRPGIHAVEAVELSLAVDLLERWRNDPAIPTVLTSMASPHDFAHTLVTLASASLLTDMGNAVELACPARHGGQRTPDLRLHLGAHTRVNAEVKVPTTLVRRPNPLEDATAVEIVRKAVASAGTGQPVS